MQAVETLNTELPRPPLVKAPPIIGNTFEMAADPARFFVRCYREYGPAFRVRVFGRPMTVIAGTEAANLLNTREGKDCLRSKEVWKPLMDEFGAKHMLTAEDGRLHMRMRTIMRRGFSKDSLRGRYNEMMRITSDSIDRDWAPGTRVPVVQSMQYLVVDQLGMVLTGKTPRDYVKDIRTTILYILNVLVTRQRPKFLMKMPKYKRAKARMIELGRQMVADYRARPEEVPDEYRTLIDDVMKAHQDDPELIPESDLVMLMTGPYVAGLDTVANTTSAIVYTILKHPDVFRRVMQEVDAVFSKPIEDEGEFLNQLPVLNSAIMETMRLYPIAVAQLRTANKDFNFQGNLIKEGEMVYLGTSVPHFLEELYPDPYRFDIDRYTPERKEHLQDGAYSPFGRGPHTCLGRSLAEVLIAMTIGQLFYKLDLELDPPGYGLKTKTAPTPGPSMNFKVRVKGVRQR